MKIFQGLLGSLDLRERRDEHFTETVKLDANNCSSYDF